MTTPQSFSDRWAALGRFLIFTGRALLSLPAALTQFSETLRQFYRVVIGSLPLSLVAGIAIGVVLWMHVRGVILRSSIGGPSALPYLPTAIALAVVLEFAPIGAGLIVAGRMGASLGAEIGAMRITEQIDALEVLGWSPLKRLVAPRILACMTALPLLATFIAATAILSGYFAEMFVGTLSPLLYEQRLWDELYLGETVASLAKTVVFGFMVGVSGCFFGMEATGGTESVGRAATLGVERSTLLVLIANVVLVKIIQTWVMS
jgi:phospholipid/cholesterol/gamma-HCH transport system permease protein